MSTIAQPPSVQSTLFTGRRDNYDGLIIDPATVPSDLNDFRSSLKSCLSEWREQGIRGVWLKLPLDHAHCIGHAVDFGFRFHHAEPDYVMMTTWLAPEENRLPPNASHQVGVGAFVFDRASGSVLVVQERHGPLRGQAIWKMPTGLVQAGEDITEAAVREVFEETGVETRFKAVLAMRQAHGMAFGKSDMFFVVGLEPTVPQQSIVIQEEELVDAQWMPLEEYAKYPFTVSKPIFKKIVDQCVAWTENRYSGMGGYKLDSGFSNRHDLLLFGDNVGDPMSDKESEKIAQEDVWVGLN